MFFCYLLEESSSHFWINFSWSSKEVLPLLKDFSSSKWLNGSTSGSLEPKSL